MGIEEKVKEFIEKEKLIRRDDRILLGLSGGADSVCLFYLLLGLGEKIGFELRAVHVHHGIRQEAEKDVSYVAALCEKEDVPCYVFREDVPVYAEENGLGEEEAGRILRYRDFQRCLENWEKEDSAAGKSDPSRFKIATAHHENDQAETVLFQLFRGCGLSGLRGILPRRGNIIRPVLCLSREEMEGYLRERDICWREDETNASEYYSRNRIRHKILPVAEEEICRGVVSHIGKTAQILREAESYMERQTESACERILSRRDDLWVFDIALLLKEDIFLQKQVILYGLERLLPARRDIGAVHVEDVLKLAQKRGNGELYLPGGVRVRKLYRQLMIFPEKGEKRQAALPVFLQEERGFLYGEAAPLFRTEKVDLSDEETVKKRFGIRNLSEIMECIPEKTYTKWFDYDKIETSFSLRHRESGDYLSIDQVMNHKSLRRYLMEMKLPVSCRDRIWLFADASHVMWVPGGRISSYYKVTKQTKTILQIEICTGE